MNPRMRRAFTLIEMVIVIAVGAALTGIAVSLLLVLFRAERVGRAYVGQAESIDQLADQFRRDVHAAVADVFVHQSDPPEWRLDLSADCSVRYTVEAGVVSREEREGTKVARRESYTVPKDATATVAVDRATNPPIVSLTIEPKEAALRPGRTFRIDAVLGRDLRFTQVPKEEK